MAPIIEGVRWLNDRLASHPLLGKATITPTSIECSTPSRNALPDQCKVYLDRRTVPGDTRASIAREIDEIGKFVKAEVRLTSYEKASYRGLVVGRERFFPAWVLDEASPVLAKASEAYGMLFGHPARIGKWDFSTDGTYSMGMKSIPTFGFGPGEERHTHSAEDQVRTEDLWKAAAFYALFPFVYSTG
jgi:putative selenium metabolism hydrolase